MTETCIRPSERDNEDKPDSFKPSNVDRMSGLHDVLLDKSGTLTYVGRLAVVDEKNVVYNESNNRIGELIPNGDATRFVSDAAPENELG